MTGRTKEETSQSKYQYTLSATKKYTYRSSKKEVVKCLNFKHAVTRVPVWAVKTEKFISEL